jgi:hypothetical protein
MFVADAGLSNTTTLAFQSGELLATGLLVDHLVKARVFVQYLNKSCVPFTSDHEILQALITKAPWERPIRVFGYNSADVIFGGDLFEAETDCVNVMGQVATAHSHNLAFWSEYLPFQPGESLPQSPSPPVTYNSSKTYVALVYGDMDNIDFVETFGRQHMQSRSQWCSSSSSSCFPLTWTLSPNLIRVAPAIMRWYYAQAALTGGQDWFM